MDLINWISEHWDDVLKIWAMVVGVASAIVRLIPPLPEGHWALPIVKLLARFVALNTPTPTDTERKMGEWK